MRGTDEAAGAVTQNSKAGLRAIRGLGLVPLGVDTAPINTTGRVTGPSMRGKDEAAEAVTQDSKARPPR